MKYGDLTEAQRKERQVIWVKHLNKICSPVLEDGTRPCDMGTICDRCHYDYDTQQAYALELKEQGLATDEDLARID
jgi:hypothetical protein